MGLANYMVEQMIRHQGKWTESVDEDGRIILVSHNRKCRGIREYDGTIVSAETLIKMYNDRI